MFSVLVNNNVPAYTARAKAVMREATKKAAFDIEAHAKAVAPVDTGNLRNTIRASGSDMAWRVDAPAGYAVYVELGTSRMAAQPFLGPAAAHVGPQLENALRSL